MNKIVVQSAGVPAGSYLAKYTGVEAQPADPLRGMGEGLRWAFEITNGPNAGKKTSRITGIAPTPGNACGKVLSGLLGKPLATGDEIDLDALVGKSYLVVVGAGPNGGATRVESVTLPPQQ